MAHPSDLIAHYSSKAFQTRMAALTVIGAVLVAASNWFKEADEANAVGLFLILVVSSLGELNRRYSYSYLCACYASTKRRRSFSAAEMEAATRWIYFRLENERPWNSAVPRFLLSWSTYIPGVLLGCFLILREGEPTGLGFLGLGLAAVLLLQWMYYAVFPLWPSTHSLRSRRKRRATAFSSESVETSEERPQIKRAKR